MKREMNFYLLKNIISYLGKKPGDKSQSFKC